jgi:diacylglycerol kinase (ATP)
MSLVLLNPHAQGGRAAKLGPAIQNWLNEYAPDTPLVVCESLESTLQTLHSLPAHTRVVAVGGDGTLNQWLPALLANDLKLGLIPQGSGNDVARALGVHDLSWQQALLHALTQPTRSMDVGLASYNQTETLFLSSFTAGFDSAVGKRAIEGPKWLRGLPRYLWATLQELAHLQTWNLQVEPTEHPAIRGDRLFASVLNTPTFGSGMPAAPTARIDDGQLDLVQAGAFNLLGTLGMLPRLLMGWHVGHPKIHLLKTLGVQIKSTQPLPLASDGEYRGVTYALRIQLAPKRLQVVTLLP